MSKFKITKAIQTPILQDFSLFLDYLEKNQITLTKKNKYFRCKDLFALNQLMSDPVEDVTKRTPQESYPELHLFYHLVLRGDLYKRKSKTKTQTLLIPTKNLEKYQELTKTEKYFFLLENFWIDTDWKELQSGTLGQADLYTVTPVLEFLSQHQAGKEIHIKNKRNQVKQMIWYWGYYLLYFELFGFWELIIDEQAKKDLASNRAIFAKKLIPTEFGIQIAKVLKEKRDLEKWNIPYREDRGEWNVIPGSPVPEIEQEDQINDLMRIFGSEEVKNVLEKEKTKESNKIRDWQEEKFFKAFIPLVTEGELQKTISKRRSIDFTAGIYIFKVYLTADLWRRIKISADATLFELHKIIQEAFNFASDHLYSFFISGQPWTQPSFSAPQDPNGISVKEVKIGELGLEVGQEILYLFDYGDEWRFSIKLEEIKSGESLEETKIIEQKGESPEQYSSNFDPEIHGW